MEEEYNLEILKENLRKLVEHHHNNCFDNECGVSLLFVRILAERAGIKFTNEEKSFYM